MMRRWVPKLMADLLRGRVRVIEPLLDLLALSIATEVYLLLVAVCLPDEWLRLYVLGAFLVLAVHIAVAASCGSSFWETMRILASAPAYILWKVRLLPEIWRTSRTDSAWKRTERDFPADGQ